MPNRWCAILCITIFLLMSIYIPVFADGGSPEQTYLITADGRRVPSPLGYTYSGKIGAGFNKPQDLFVETKTGNLYIADTGKNRILEYNEQGQLLLEIGESAGLNSPEGLFVDSDQNIWVADTGNNRVVVFTQQGSYKVEYQKPESDLLIDYEFSPRKIVVDRRGFIFVVTGSQENLGVLVFDTSHRFRGFFGRARVQFDLLRFLSNLIATDAQRVRMEKVKPEPLGNILLDDQGFIYAVSPVLKVDQIQRLNAVGENVYGSGLHTGAGRLLDKLTGGEGQSFGEFTESTNSMSQFIDIAVDNNLGVVSVLDVNTSQVYQYDQTGNLLTIFGGRGQRRGLFASPSSIAAGKDGILYVLDEGRGDIEVFTPTLTMRKIHQAANEFNAGDYQKAAVYWGDIASLNTNFMLAHSGLGKALLRQGLFAESMKQYRLADDQSGYSDAFQEFRYAWLRDNFGPVGLFVFVLLILSALLGKNISASVNYLRQKTEQILLRTGSWSVLIFLGLSILSWMAGLSMVSFHFRTQRPDQTRLIFESGKIIIPWITWCLSSFGISQIFFGIGNLKQIMNASARALYPIILFAIPINLMTNILTLGEAGLIQWAWYIVGGLLVWQFYRQGEQVHNFSIRQSIVVFILNLFGILVLWALVGLVYTLTTDIVRFIGQIILEIYVRRF